MLCAAIIFDKFVQVGKNNHDYQGSGLGLSIVKKLIELFKSKIYVSSIVGQGTQFNFAINFKIQDIANQQHKINQSVIVNKKLKILVVEDNKINQIVTKKIIEKHNCECWLVDNGHKAIAIMSEQNFDVILMDINMPEINGYETAQLIRIKDQTTPIIALTAYSKNEVIDKVLLAGMNDIIIKPFAAEELFLVINKHLTN